jgi:2-polyprenyl-3-methyl-5-hydroxy-6-metoxy-1,4-benzoquinol methylase
MDQPGVDVSELSNSLRDLDVVNRWLGGKRGAVRSVLELVERMALRGAPREAKILDVGTGGADVPLGLIKVARENGIRLRIAALDVHPATLDFARKATANEPDIEVLAGDGRSLPFADRAFDIAMCCTALHHFETPEAIVVLRELNRVARVGIVVTDLARSRTALFGALLLSNSVWRRHPITRHDGPASVRAAFTVQELRELATAAAVEGAVRVRRDPIFRLSLVSDRLSVIAGMPQTQPA